MGKKVTKRVSVGKIKTRIQLHYHPESLMENLDLLIEATDKENADLKALFEDCRELCRYAFKRLPAFQEKASVEEEK